MTTKKGSSKKRRASTADTARPLCDRAHDIIADPEGYDRDTRRAVELSLEDLRETVARAGAGETVLDLTDPAQAAADAPDLAEMVAAVWHHPDCPEEIREALNVGTSDLFNRLNEEEGGSRVYRTAPYIRALLLEHAAREGEEGHKGD